MESIKTMRVQGLLEGDLPLITGFGTIHSVFQSQNSFSQGHYSRKPVNMPQVIGKEVGPIGYGLMGMSPVEHVSHRPIVCLQG